MSVVADVFLEGYEKTNGNESIAKAKAPKHLLPFRPEVTLQIQKVIREARKRHSS